MPIQCTKTVLLTSVPTTDCLTLTCWQQVNLVFLVFSIKTKASTIMQYNCGIPIVCRVTWCNTAVAGLITMSDYRKLSKNVLTFLRWFVTFPIIELTIVEVFGNLHTWKPTNSSNTALSLSQLFDFLSARALTNVFPSWKSDWQQGKHHYQTGYFDNKFLPHSTTILLCFVTQAWQTCTTETVW